MWEKERSAVVKKELRNTQVYLRKGCEYSARYIEITSRMQGIKSPSLSSEGCGSHSTSKDGVILKYTNLAEALKNLKNLYSKRVELNMSIIKNAPARVRNLIFGVLVNKEISYEDAEEIYQVSARKLRAAVDDFLKRDDILKIADDEIAIDAQISEWEKKLRIAEEELKESHEQTTTTNESLS